MLHHSESHVPSPLQLLCQSESLQIQKYLVFLGAFRFRNLQIPKVSGTSLWCPPYGIPNIREALIMVPWRPLLPARGQTKAPSYTIPLLFWEGGMKISTAILKEILRMQFSLYSFYLYMYSQTYYFGNLLQGRLSHKSCWYLIANSILMRLLKLQISCSVFCRR